MKSELETSIAEYGPSSRIFDVSNQGFMNGSGKRP
jgi:hypothetical protein